MEISYRQLLPDEIDDACALCWEVFLVFEAPDYSDEGVEEFYQFLDPDYLIHRMGEGVIRFWGAFLGEEMVGVCAISDLSHINLLFVRGQYHRQGVATALLKRALLDCKRVDLDLNRMTVHSSPYAVPFYLALGFVPLSGEMEQNGIRFTPMELLDKKKDEKA